MKNNDVFIRTFPMVWIYTIIVSVILFLTVGTEYGISFILGSATSLYAMSMLYKSSKKIMQSDKETAQKIAVRNYAFRFMFYAIILVAAALSENLEVLGTAFGLFSFKIVLYLNVWIERRGEKQ